MTRVLLIGGAGQLGTAIQERWSDCEIVAPSHEELDLSDTRRFHGAIERLRPDVIVNAAAFHDVDRCEREPQQAFAINSAAVAAAARCVRDRDAAFLTISTDYVFDGEASAPYAEDCAPHPISFYGASKLAGEYSVESLAMRSYVVRTCGLYGTTNPGRDGRSFVERVLRHRDGPLSVVSDVIASPTFAGHLADALRRLIETESYGLYHAVNAGAISWYDFACDAVRRARADVELQPIPASQRQAAARRPRFSALSNAKLAALEIEMPPLDAGIAAFIAERLR